MKNEYLHKGKKSKSNDFSPLKEPFSMFGTAMQAEVAE